MENFSSISPNWFEQARHEPLKVRSAAKESAFGDADPAP
jgi:hypothetical protein